MAAQRTRIGVNVFLVRFMHLRTTCDTRNTRRREKQQVTRTKRIGIIAYHSCEADELQDDESANSVEYTTGCTEGVVKDLSHRLIQ